MYESRINITPIIMPSIPNLIMLAVINISVASTKGIAAKAEGAIKFIAKSNKEQLIMITTPNVINKRDQNAINNKYFSLLKKLSNQYSVLLGDIRGIKKFW